MMFQDPFTMLNPLQRAGDTLEVAAVADPATGTAAVLAGFRRAVQFVSFRVSMPRSARATASASALTRSCAPTAGPTGRTRRKRVC